MRTKLLALVFVSLLSLPVLAATFTVTEVLDDIGVPSLRRAINDANGRGGVNTIQFNIPTSEATWEAGNPSVKWYRISPTTELPTIECALTIDGTTQPTTDAYNNPYGPEIEIRGSSSFIYGLRIAASDCTIKGLAVNGFSKSTAPKGSGIRVDSGSNNRIYGCYIGTDVTGESAVGNYFGVLMQSDTSNNLVGSTETANRNLISGNNINSTDSVGIYFYTGGDSNEADGNYVGTDRTGAASVPNSFGIRCVGSYERIGNGSTAGRNVISGNNYYGIYSEGVGTNVMGNYIGVNAAGTAGLGNGRGTSAPGIEVYGNSCGVGDGTAGGRNIISGNVGGGLLCSGSNNVILGNDFGTDASGVNQIANTNVGLLIKGESNHVGDGTIGGINLISGNSADGIRIAGGISNEILRNYIGLNKNGTALGNGGDGIFITEYAGETVTFSQSNMIGDGTANGRNVISANSCAGIEISWQSISNEVKCNYIGTGTNGLSDQGNGMAGVFISGESTTNQIGPDNVIAFNGKGGSGPLDGVQVNDVNTARNQITRNSMFSNAGLGILLANGGNNNMSAPAIITAIYNADTKTTVTGECAAGASVEIFAVGAADPSGSGEGKIYEGTAGDSNLDGKWSAVFSATYGLTEGTTITATATDSNNNTSMFSLNARVSTTTTTTTTTSPTTTTTTAAGSTTTTTTSTTSTTTSTLTTTTTLRKGQVSVPWQNKRGAPVAAGFTAAMPEEYTVVVLNSAGNTVTPSKINIKGDGSVKLSVTMDPATPAGVYLLYVKGKISGQEWTASFFYK